jgi:hypothetical protein
VVVVVDQTALEEQVPEVLYTEQILVFLQEHLIQLQ